MKVFLALIDGDDRAPEGRSHTCSLLCARLVLPPLGDSSSVVCSSGNLQYSMGALGLESIAHVVYRLDPVVKDAAEVGRLRWALAWVLRHENVVFTVCRQ